MAIRHITGTEDVPQLKNQIDDDNGSWWGGVRLAGATTIALAAGLAITALSSQVAQNVANSHQDDPAGSLVNLKVEEDYWQYRLPSKTDYFVAAQYDTPETVTQPTFSPDEDAWQSPTPPAQVIQYAQPWAFSQDETFFFPDEDYWQQPLPNQPVSFAQPVFDQDEVPPVVVANAFDEDYWQNSVRPVLMAFAQMAPWFFDDVRIPPPAPAPPATGRPVRIGFAFLGFK